MKRNMNLVRCNVYIYTSRHQFVLHNIPVEHLSFYYFIKIGYIIPNITGKLLELLYTDSSVAQWPCRNGVLGLISSIKIMYFHPCPNVSLLPPKKVYSVCLYAKLDFPASSVKQCQQVGLCLQAQVQCSDKYTYLLVPFMVHYLFKHLYYLRPQMLQLNGSAGCPSSAIVENVLKTHQTYILQSIIYILN